MADSTGLHIAVIGGGPGGYAAAFLAADLGMTVTLIDPELNPGGVCLYRGCIPSKSLLHVAKLIDETRHAKNWGIDYADPSIDLPRLRTWKEGVVKKLTGGLGVLTKQRKVEYIQGRAAFQNSNTLRVSRTNGGEDSLTFDRIIIATGSRPAIIPSLTLETPRMMDSTSALDLTEVPGTLLVVGGGYIGLELGTVYAALGSKVSVVEMLPGLLPGADRDLVLPLHKRIEKNFDSILLNTTVASRERRIQLESALPSTVPNKRARKAVRQSSGFGGTQAQFRNPRLGENSSQSRPSRIHPSQQATANRRSRCLCHRRRCRRAYASP
jgi:dihydrolipoamide dehydrogenase